MRTLRSIDHRADDGIAVVVAILLMAMMLSLGLASITLVDTQSKLTGNQRQRESSFNVAEAALNAQVTRISDHWAGKAAYTDATLAFGTCPGSSYCPNPAQLTSMIPSADTKVPVVWKTDVYDDAGTLQGYFADSRIPANVCHCDYNDNGKVWVRAEALIRGHKRAIVSLVQKQTQAESVVHAAIIAGSLTITNQGLRKTPIIDTNGGVLAVRCKINDATLGGPCMGHTLGEAPTKTDGDWTYRLSNEISGFSSYQDNYSTKPLFAQDQVQRFIDTALAEGTYYTGCPSSLAGHVVVINTTGVCSYKGNTVFNSQQSPGFVMMMNSASSFDFGGGVQYYGVIYHANMGKPPALASSPQSSGTLLSIIGNAKIIGGVLIDGPGRVEAGSNGGGGQEEISNITFDDHAFGDISSYAAAGIVQNSWREITPGA